MKSRKKEIFTYLQDMINQAMRQHSDFREIKRVEDRVTAHTQKNSHLIFSGEYCRQRLRLQQFGIKQIITTINIVENGLKAFTLDEYEISKLYMPTHRLFHTKLLELSNAVFFKIVFSALVGIIGVNVFGYLAFSSFNASEPEKTFQYTAATLLLPYLLSQRVFDAIQAERQNFIRDFFGMDFAKVKNLCAEYQELKDEKLSSLASSSRHIYLSRKMGT